MLKTLVNYRQSIFFALSPKAISNLYLLFKIQTYCILTVPVEKQNDYEWCRIWDLWWGFDFMWFVGALEEVGVYCLCIWAWSHCWLVELAVKNTNQMQSEVKWEQKGMFIHPSLPPTLTMMMKWKELLPLAMEPHTCLPLDWEVEGGVVGLDVVPCQQDEYQSDHRMHGCGGPWHSCWPLEQNSCPTDLSEATNYRSLLLPYLLQQLSQCGPFFYDIIPVNLNIWNTCSFNHWQTENGDEKWESIYCRHCLEGEMRCLWST